MILYVNIPILNTDTEYTLLIDRRIFFLPIFFFYTNDMYCSGFFIYKIFLCCIYEEQYGGVHVSAIKIILQWLCTNKRIL